MVVERFGVYLVNLDPVGGRKISKSRPCRVVSPDEMNRNIRTAIIAPMTTAAKNYPTRVRCTFDGKRGEIVLDQIRTGDQYSLVRKLGTISTAAATQTLTVLRELFA